MLTCRNYDDEVRRRMEELMWQTYDCKNYESIEGSCARRMGMMGYGVPHLPFCCHMKEL
jgi:hypothetical protein